MFFCGSLCLAAGRRPPFEPVLLACVPVFRRVLVWDVDLREGGVALADVLARVRDVAVFDDVAFFEELPADRFEAALPLSNPIRACTSWSFRMACQPRIPFFLAISASSFVVRDVNEAAVIKLSPQSVRWLGSAQTLSQIGGPSVVLDWPKRSNAHAAVLSRMRERAQKRIAYRTLGARR